MQMNEYQKAAARTMNPALYCEQQAMHALHGMTGEVGEIHSLYQKAYQGHPFNHEHMKKELGDLLWFIAEYCTAMNWTLDGEFEPGRASIEVENLYHAVQIICPEEVE